MEQISTALISEGHLDQGLLSSLARKPLKQYLKQEFGNVSAVDVHLLWKKLAGSLKTQNMPEKYLTAACNSVSVFLLAGSTAPAAAVRDVVFSRSVWLEGYRCVEYAFSCGKTKPALQVLETLGHLLKEHSDKQLASDLLSESSRSLVSTVLTDEPQGNLKASCISLSCFIKRTTVLPTLSEIVSSCLQTHSGDWKRRRALNHMPAEKSLKRMNGLQELFLALLFAVNDLGTRSAALKLFSQLCSNPNLAQGCAVAQAAEVLEHYIEQNLEALSDFADNVLPVILDDRAQFDAFLRLYSTDVMQSEARLVLYLGVVKAGRLKSFISEDDLPMMIQLSMNGSKPGSYDENCPYQALGSLLQAGNSGVRLYAYDIITASFATKASIPTGVLHCLLGCYRYLYDDNDAYERGELLGITRRFLKRLNNSYLSLDKLRSMDKISDADIVRMSEYENFTNELAQFLSSELEIGIAYQRHILSLQTLQLLLKTSFVQWTNNESLRARVAALILDAYDDVRALSAFILSSLSEKGNSTSIPTRNDLSKGVVALAAETCRHDHADAAGQILAVESKTRYSSTQPTATLAIDGDQGSLSTVLLAKLSAHVDSALNLRPDSMFPLHAYLLALTHIHAVEAIGKRESNGTLHVCSRIWKLVQPELCIDSPEKGTEDIEMEGSRGPKDLLAYAWRALRDSSLLLQALIKWDQTALPRIGSLCMQQLTQLRHRGAFSTVAQTFALCCDTVRTSSDNNTRSLIGKWYESAFAEIDVQARQVTRRSAGLPAMFNAVISPTDGDMFNVALSSLKAKATLPVSEEDMRQAEQSLPQVHALNCIKDIVANSKFRTLSEQYISELIDLAADRLSSDLWAIRNCGLMLLRACMMRLDPRMVESSLSPLEFDAGKSSRRSPIFVSLELLESLKGDILTTEHASRGSEKIFAALDLVRHVGQAGYHDESLRRLIRQHLASPIWGIRDHAARVLAARVALSDDWATVVAKCSISALSSENEAHGVLLYLRYCFDINGEQLASYSWKSVVQPTLSVIHDVAERRKTKALSPFIEAALLDLVNAILKLALVRGDLSYEAQKIGVALDPLAQEVNASNAFYQQRRLLHRIYCSLSNAKQSTHLDPAIVDSLGDADVKRFATENLQHLVVAMAPGIEKPGLGHLLAHLALCSESGSGLGCLMTTIASSLEDGKAGLSLEVAQALLHRCISLPEPHGRDLSNGRIRLQAALIKTLGFDTSSGIHESLMRTLVAEVAAAAQDWLELPTRLTAAHAISNCIEEVLNHRQDLDLEGKEYIPLQLLTILYDELNDDDEEIRQIAQETVRKVFNTLPGARRIIRLCSAASREALLELIVGLYGKSTALPEIAVARSAGSTQYSMSLTRALAETVEQKLEIIVKSMNDLFAEERQNLYIDELNEIKMWSNAFRRCSCNGLRVGLWLQAARWCHDGIKVLQPVTSALPGDGSSQTSALGVTHNIDILELCMRVIHLSQALLAEDVKPAAEKLGQEAMVLREKLVAQLSAWQTTLHNVGAHPLLAATINHNG